MKRGLAMASLVISGLRTGSHGFSLKRSNFWQSALKQRSFSTRRLASLLEATTAEATLEPTTSSTTNKNEPKKSNFLDLSQDDLTDLLKLWGHPSYRSKQVWDWVSTKGAASFGDMGNVPKALRAQLSAHFTIGSMQVAVEQVSKDGTRKRAYELWDGQLVEAVLMPYNDGRRTACISSQAGCGMGCTFCATGQMGFARHLTSTEIFEQAQQLSAELVRKGERLSNVVMMGMGEPLANYDNVLAACRRIQNELGIGARHITISTVGLVPRIKQLAKEPEQFTLAVSLHEASDEARSKIMPVNRRFGIAELMEACEEYVAGTGRRVTFEWALISGVNDGKEVARSLGKLLAPLKGKCHVNIIPLNPTGGYEGKPADAKALSEFIHVLEKSYGIPATARVRRGIDIDAGCGQLTQRRKKADDKKDKRESATAAAEVETTEAEALLAVSAPTDKELEEAKAREVRVAEAAALGRSGVPSEGTVAGGWG
mmetsp:Transcript_7873/g.16175  ORF Transcript_7873/g.16175 Transcript_7873/m.16175 type:complete len:485 (-) Transcript_7873:146-1600(-)